MKTKTQPGKNHYKIFPINSKQNKQKPIKFNLGA